MSGCTTLDTLTTVCSSTPPLPTTGVNLAALVAGAALFSFGIIATFVAGRR